MNNETNNQPLSLPRVSFGKENLSVVRIPPLHQSINKRYGVLTGASLHISQVFPLGFRSSGDYGIEGTIGDNLGRFLFS